VPRLGVRRPPVESDPELEELVALARSPLPPLPEPAEVETPEAGVVDEAVELGARPQPEALSLVERMTAAAMEALVKLAEKPASAPPNVHVHLASPDLSVRVEQPASQTHVHLPDQEPPSVHVDVAAPDVRPPDVHVDVAAAEVRPPDVHVNVEAPAPAEPSPVYVTVEAPPPRPIRVETGADGSKRYIPEEEASRV
jgi:hypothetical protein